MNQMQIFNNAEFGEIRTIEENEQVYFCGSDVAKALGYLRPADAILAHCKGAVKRSTLTNGGAQELNFIPESDLYRLIINSKLPKAEEFEKWVMEEVLPSIRKHGAYITPSKVEDILNDPDVMIALLTELKNERAANTKLIAENEALKPKATYYDLVLQCKDLMAITLIAKDYGKSAKWLNKTLYDLGVQYLQSGMWVLYQKYAGNGYTQSKTFPTPDTNGDIHNRPHTYWTQKGRLFIYDLLKKNGILPAMETEKASA